MRKFLQVCVGICLFFTGGTTARAQAAAHLTLYGLQTDSFPAMSVDLDAFDMDGNFVTGLTPDAITLLEDGQPRPLTGLEELQPGVEFVLALDPGPYFAYQDANAVTRFDKVEKVLREWLDNHPDSLDDDLSLLTTGGASSTHVADTSAFLDALAAYQPNLWNSVSTPQTLSAALDVISESTSRPDRKPAILYITSVPAAEDIQALQNLAQRAVAGNTRIYVWVVTSKDFSSTTGATALKDLATQTGGQYIFFSGEEPLTSPELYLAPLRHAYRLSYSSAVLTSGDHTLTAQISLNGETVSSTTQSFSLDIQPPNPILVDPPDQIVRTAPDERTTAISSFIPAQQSISIIVEFPDGRTRALARTALYVDGALVDEKTATPFDHFTWDLSGYTESGQHVLSVEAQDIYGLSKVSVGVPVLVTIVKPQAGLIPWLFRNSQGVVLGAIFFTGGLLLTILVGSRRRKRLMKLAGRGSPSDPLTQSVRSAGKKRNLSLPWSRPAKPSDAYLVRLKSDGQPITAPPISITLPETIFGSDPIKATYILDDPSVSPLHARLKQQQDAFFLSDEKSVAGTWVNYEPVTTPRRLQHGDVLHIGVFSYRFMLRRPPERPAPQVTPT
jgi:hypothetical protein